MKTHGCAAISAGLAAKKGSFIKSCRFVHDKVINFAYSNAVNKSGTASTDFKSKRFENNVRSGRKQAGERKPAGRRDRQGRRRISLQKRLFPARLFRRALCPRGREYHASALLYTAREDAPVKPEQPGQKGRGHRRADRLLPDLYDPRQPRRRGPAGLRL